MTACCWLSNPVTLLHKFFVAQWENPSKQDWTEQVRKYLKDLQINLSLSEIRSKSTLVFKNMVKMRVREFALDSLNMKKFEHTKMDELVFTELKIQKYLESEELTVNQKRNIFALRTRMADFGENFRNGGPSIPCKMCGLHVDSQTHAVNCQEILNSVKVTGNYQEIFTDNISRETAKMLEMMSKLRKDKLD